MKLAVTLMLCALSAQAQQKTPCTKAELQAALAESAAVAEKARRVATEAALRSQIKTLQGQVAILKKKDAVISAEASVAQERVTAARGRIGKLLEIVTWHEGELARLRADNARLIRERDKARSWKAAALRTFTGKKLKPANKQ